VSRGVIGYRQSADRYLFFRLLPSSSLPLDCFPLYLAKQHTAFLYILPNDILGNMVLPKPFSLDPYKGILINHENGYRETRGERRQKVLVATAKEVIAQSEGQLVDNDVEPLVKVCLPTDKQI